MTKKPTPSDPLKKDHNDTTHTDSDTFVLLGISDRPKHTERKDRP